MRDNKYKLPKKTDLITIKSLIKSKFFLVHLPFHFNNFSTLNRIITIHGLDYSIEYLN